MLLSSYLTATALALVAVVSPIMAASEPCALSGGHITKGNRMQARPYGRWRHHHHGQHHNASDRAHESKPKKHHKKPASKAKPNKTVAKPKHKKQQQKKKHPSEKKPILAARPQKPPPSAPVSNEGGDVNAATDGLKVHNDFRAKYGAEALTWNSTIAKGAQAYADSCAMEHSGAAGLGENLSWGPRDINGGVQLWLNEAKDYDYSHPGFSSGTGHFTQVVWKNTKQVGCAYSSCSGKNSYGSMIVCRYYPPGNYVNAGQFEANVGRPVN